MKKRGKGAYKKERPFIRTKESMIHRDLLLEDIFRLILDSKLFGNIGRFHKDLANAYKSGNEKILKNYIWDSQCELVEIEKRAVMNNFKFTARIKELRNNLENFKALTDKWSNTKKKERHKYDIEAEILLNRISSFTNDLLRRIKELQNENVEEVLGPEKE